MTAVNKHEYQGRLDKIKSLQRRLDAAYSEMDNLALHRYCETERHEKIKQHQSKIEQYDAVKKARFEPDSFGFDGFVEYRGHKVMIWFN
jgi:hypothetical protein